MDSYMGTVSAFAFNFTPSNWMACNGAILAISSNSALFALIGTTYGGNGVQTFALPDLRGRMAIGMGQGLGQPLYTIGQIGGSTGVTLTVANLAAHTHTGTLAVVGSARTPAVPAAGNILDTATTVPGTPAPTTVPLGGVTTLPTGNNTPVPIMPPYLALNYCICTNGIFPPRN